MRQITFADTGEQVSELCLGTMNFGHRCDQAQSDQILGTALDGGINFVDTAAMYGDGACETILGNIIGDRRDDIFLTTKVHAGVDAETITSSIDDSLARLQTDRVDLYLIHWPQLGMNPAEMMAALNDVVTAGKARYVGCSNYPAWLLAYSNAVAAREGWPRLVNNQIPYNLVERGVEVEVLPQAIYEQIAITVYRPVLMGVLSGKYRPNEPIPEDSRGMGDERVGRWLADYSEGIMAFLAMAEELATTPAALATAWVLRSPGVASAIVGVSSAVQLETTLAHSDLALTDEQYERLTGLFDTAVKEVAGGEFANLRRELALLG